MKKKDYYTNKIDQLLFFVYDFEFLEGEVFTPIAEENQAYKYFVSNKGRLISLVNKQYRLRKRNKTKERYVEYELGNQKKYYAHRLVYKAFRPSEDITDKEIHHIDFNSCNNDLFNLYALSKEQHDKLHSLYRKLIKGFIPFV